MLRRLLWWSADRPTVLPWAIFLSLLLLIVGDGVRSTLSALAVKLVYSPFYAITASLPEPKSSRRIVDSQKRSPI